MDLAAKIRHVQDFPKKGIGFKDITTLLKDGPAYQEAVRQIWEPFAASHIDVIVGIEARGFFMAGALAMEHGIGLVPVRKQGKLPAEIYEEEYVLEYGTDIIEMHKDAIQEGQRVLLVDDLLATGGTMAAACRLVEKAGGIVTGIGLFIELDFLHGRDKIQSYQVHSLIHYESE